MERVARCPKPVIAGVRGQVSGGGLGLVAACDVVVADPAATFQLPEVLIGMVPLLITPFLLRRLAPARVAYLALGSRTLSASSACQLGLVDELASAPLETHMSGVCRRLLCSSPAAIATFKRCLADWEGEQFEAKKQLALRESARWLSSPAVADSLRVIADGSTPPWFAAASATGGP